MEEAWEKKSTRRHRFTVMVLLAQTKESLLLDLGLVETAGGQAQEAPETIMHRSFVKSICVAEGMQPLIHVGRAHETSYKDNPNNHHLCCVLQFKNH